MTTIIIIIIAYILYVGYRSSSKKRKMHDQWRLTKARNSNESGGNPLKLNPHFCEIAHLNKKIYEESFPVN